MDILILYPFNQGKQPETRGLNLPPRIADVNQPPFPQQVLLFLAVALTLLSLSLIVSTIYDSHTYVPVGVDPIIVDRCGYRE